MSARTANPPSKKYPNTRDERTPTENGREYINPAQAAIIRAMATKAFIDRSYDLLKPRTGRQLSYTPLYPQGQGILRTFTHGVK